MRREGADIGQMDAFFGRIYPRRNSSWLGRAVLLCAGLGLGATTDARAAAYYSHSSSSFSTLTTGISIGPIDWSATTYGYPTVTSTYWTSRWSTADWPSPAALEPTITAPASSLTVGVQTDSPAALSIGTFSSEFYLMDADGRMHAAPIRHPDQWLPINAPAALPGQEGFSFYDGVQLLTEDGFASYDPGPHVIGPFSTPPALVEDHPVRFPPHSRVFVRPGVTYGHASYWTHAPLVAKPNFGLVLPHPFGAEANAPLRAHTISKIINARDFFYALGELHPETPGFAPGTQAIFKASSEGVSWTFQPLPKAPGRWHDLAVALDSIVVGQQIVLVGDGGIYTTRNAGGTWLHITNNLTTATATGFTLTLPAGAGAPLDEQVSLKLNSVVWAKDRFIAAGRARTADGQPIYIEGLSKHWFAYPLPGWPADRSVDQIQTNQTRFLLLSTATASGAPALLAASLTDASAQGTAPVLSSASTHAPELGKTAKTPLTLSSDRVDRFIIEGEASKGWSINRNSHDAPIAFLIPPYDSNLARSYHLRDEPLHLTITAVNEFGRSAPLEVTIDPVVPAPFAENNSPKLIIPTTVKAVFGAAVRIPIKAEKDRNWSPNLIWAYKLPEGLAYDWREKAIIGRALVSGTHPIHVLAINRFFYSNGSAASLAAPITLIVGTPKTAPIDAGIFNGLFDGPENLVGSWTLTLGSDRNFTGSLTLPSGKHAFRGALIAEETLPGTYSAQLQVTRKKLPSVELTLVLHAAEGRVALYAASGTDEAVTRGGTVAHIPWAKDRLAPRSGDYTAAITLSATETSPFTGTGFLRMKISNLGKASVRGELANGEKWTASAPLAADGRLPITSQIARGRSVRGMLAFSDTSVTATKFHGDLDWRGNLKEKCPDYGAAAALTVAGEIAPKVKIDTHLFLDAGLNSLMLRHPDLARFGILDGEAVALFDTYTGQPIFTRSYLTRTNPLKMSLRFDVTAKSASGAFTVAAGKKPLTISLRGAPRIDPDTGEVSAVGYFLLPSADNKTRLSGKFHAAGRRN